MGDVLYVLEAKRSALSRSLNSLLEISRTRS